MNSRRHTDSAWKH